MRVPSFAGTARLLPVLAALITSMPNGVAAQELALSSRAPRFLFVSSPHARPVEVDVSRTALLQRTVSLDVQRPTVGRLLVAIERQTGIRFGFSRDVLPPDRMVALRAETITVGAALLSILMDTGLDVLLSSNGKVALVEKGAGAPVVQRGAVVGRVTDAGTGQGLDAAEVLLEGTRLRVLAGADGRYRIADVDAGSYTVVARRIGYARNTQSVTVRADEETTVNFALDASPTQLEELVTVTPGGIQSQAKALPTPITVITADDIAERGLSTMANVIRQAVPGVTAFEAPHLPNRTSFSARGASSLTSSTMKIYLDGVETAEFVFTSVDPASIERIEILRGPQAATVYGADAAGGVVQIFTKRGDPNLSLPQVDAKLAVGLAQTPYDGVGEVLRQQYAGSARGGGAEASYNFGGSYSHLADWLPNDASSAQSSPGVYGGMRYTRGVITADLSARYFRHGLAPGLNPLLETSGFIPFSRPDYQRSDAINQTYGAQVSVSPTSRWQNRVTLGLDQFTSEDIQTQPRRTTPSDTLYTVVRSGRSKVSIGYNGSLTAGLSSSMAGTLTAGIDHYEQGADLSFTSSALNTEGTIQTSPPGAFSVSRSATTNTGYFGQAEVSLRDAVFLTLGLRADDNSTFGQDLGLVMSPRVGLSVLRPVGGATVKVRGSYGRAIRAPLPGVAFGGADAFSITLANPLLAPERQRGWDAGIDVVGDRWSLSVTGYDQTAENLVTRVQVASTPLLTFQFQNIGQVTNRGVEIEGALGFDLLQLKAQYGYVHSRVDDLGPNVSPTDFVQVGDQPLTVPAHTAGATVTVAPRPGTALVAGLTYVGGLRSLDNVAQFRCLGGTGPCQPTTRGYIVSYPGFAKVNASLTQEITRQASGFIAIENLTNNVAYQASDATAVMGRIAMAGLQLRLH